MSRLLPISSLFEPADAAPTYSDLTVLSMGLGQDSHTILFKIVYDEGFRRKYAPDRLLVLFSETGNEHHETYRYQDEVTIPFCKKHGIEYVTIMPEMGFHGNTWQSLTSQWELGNPTIGSVAYPKSCTHQLKLQPQYNFVEKYIATHYSNIPYDRRKGGYKHFAKYHGKIRWLVGIAKGEESRVADAEAETARWKKQAVEVLYPLIAEGFGRQECQDYMREIGKPIPMPSNCMYCPYASNHMEILWLWHSYPDNFYDWAAREQKKLDAHADADRNLGVCGRLHKEGDRTGEAVTLIDLLEEAKARYPDVTLNELNEWKWSHGHCVASKY
jgi:3'-phosphoadenosine 5'-phosphosulfate sulfotransferase (PAPS reductase)/FAD synthetase